MIIHFIPAEKFVHRAISLFEEAFPGENRFYVFGKKSGFDTKKNTDKFITVKLKDKWWDMAFWDFKPTDKIVFHSLYKSYNVFLANADFLIKNEKHFMFWGAELYNMPSFWPNSIFGSTTSSLSKSKKFDIKQRLKNFFNASITKYLYPKKYNASNPSIQDKKRALQAMNIIHTHVKEDFLNLKQVMNINADWSNFSYYTNEDYIAEKDKTLGTKILIGNSASASNNHLEVFEILKRLEVNNEMVCPLNYGDSNYAAVISKIGADTFGSKFIALNQFLSLEEYNKIQIDCGIVIMNHYRQQACGNIIAALNMGCKVFLSHKSPLLKHFKCLGVYVYCIETDLNSVHDFQVLDIELIIANRAALKKYYDRSVIIDSLKKSFSSKQ